MSEGRLVESTVAMPDGVALAVNLYLPPDESGPQPCIVEALPYRKDDVTSSYGEEYTRLRDEHGYVVCRVDLRGTGSSGGVATDEYPEQEQRDLAELFRWLAAQDWCDGNIGMYGTSYSGFNSLQMACERPPELKAVVAIYATDDRYTDDVHYRGGILRFLDLVDYCHYMTAMNALPPVPALWGEDWREEWQRRIATTEPWLSTWLGEQRDGSYWRHGSVRPDYARIECPVMIVAGWADGYRNNSFRTVAALRAAGVPHRLLAGPWAHASTSTAIPGPRIDLLPEMVAWWDRWLRGRATGVDCGPISDPASPAISCFVRSSTRPEPDLDRHEGEWIREEWPTPRSEPRQLQLTARPALPVRAGTGVAAWIDCAGHLPYGLSQDQRYDDAASVCWEWAAGDTVLLGHPVVRLRVSADAPVAFCSVKLCDVFPDGTSALVTRGTLNLTHRDGHRDPVPLTPGRQYDVEVELDACAYRFGPGQRVRLSLSGVDWPNTAAPPEPVSLEVHGGVLTLPHWAGPSPYPPPTFAPGADSAEDAADVTWSIRREVLGRRTECVVDHGARYDVRHDGVAAEHYSGTVSVDERTLEQRATAEAQYELAWPGIEVRTRAALDLRADAECYDVDVELEASEGDEVVGCRHWHLRLPRDLA